MKYEYIVTDSKKFDKADTVEVYRGSSLGMALNMVRRRVDTAPEWVNAPKIYVKNNNIHPYRTSAAALKNHPRKVLVSSFARQIVIVRQPF